MTGFWLENRKLLAYTLLSVTSLCTCFPKASLAQAAIAPDNTLPVNTLVNFNSENQTYTITGGTQVGANQFHSFQELSVPTSNTAHFDNALTTTNVIGRVTGSNISNIDGLIKTNGATNLYLVNPNGITFGANAKLDIAGSFSASTANSIKFSDGSEFSATNPQAPPLLNVNVPLGLQYGNSNVGSTISNSGNLVAGQDLVLNADKLDLQGSLQAGRDLTLQAQDVVKIRDTVATPSFSVAGRDLLVQGNQSVDIFALNNVNSGFWSGGNMVLRSQNPAIGDAHFYAGNNLKIEKLDGSLGNLISPNDPVILANGDVELGDYTGASLHILAGGSVTLGNVTINSTGDVATTINPNNTTLFNVTKTYADLATFNLTDYNAVLNSDGTVKEVVPVQTPITISGDTRATLDVRAGVDWSKLSGLSTSPTIAGTVTPTPTYLSSPVNTDITVNGNIRISEANGLVLLTNQFSPNGLTGTISIKGIDTSTNVTEANGGDIRVYGRGDIVVQSPLLSYSAPSTGDAGNGGAISLISESKITLEGSIGINSFSAVDPANGYKSRNGGNVSIASSKGIILSGGAINSTSFSNSGVAGNGGKISLIANSGEINLTSSILFSFSRSESSTGKSGDGGTISISSYSGDILLENYSKLLTNSFSFNGDAGNSGNISIASNSGRISLKEVSPVSSPFINNNSGSCNCEPNGINSSSYSIDGNAGNSGSIFLASNVGNILLENANLYSNSYSTSTVSGNAGVGGKISFLSNYGSITLNNSSLRSNSFSLANIVGNGGEISLAALSSYIFIKDSPFDSSSSAPSATASNGGNISLIAKSNIDFERSYLYAYSVSTNNGNSGNGGNISLSSTSGQVTLIDNSPLYSYSYAKNGSASNGGVISLRSSSDISIDNSFLVSFSAGAKSQNGGEIFLSSEVGNILLNSNIYSLSYATSGNSAKGGDIKLAAVKGSITSPSNALSKPLITSSSFAENGLPSGIGGKVTLDAANQISNLIIATQSSLSQAGDVNINGYADLNISNLEISTSQTVSGTVVAPTNSGIPDQTITFNVGATGRSGDVIVKGISSLIFDSNIINSTTQSSDTAGNISISSPISVTFQNNNQIFSNSNNIGNAGSVAVTAGKSITVQGNSRITALTNGQGNAGDITINAPLFAITDISQLLAETNSAGAGGNITINAPTSVSLTRIAGSSPVLSVQTRDAGRAGNILINTPILTLSDQSRITATATATSTNTEGGGSITLNASTMNLFGTVGVFAETQGIAPAGTLFLSPYGNDTALSIALTPNSQISASTTGQGNGGNLFVAAPQAITVSGNGKLAVETTGTGNAGNINFSTQNLTLTDGVLVSASTSGTGKAGDITVNANNFTLSNGAKIQTTTSGVGNSGTIKVNVGNNIILQGNGTGLFADTTIGSSGNGGSINIDPEFVLLQDGAKIAVGSLGSGIGGNITLISNYLSLLNGSSITAETASTNGGNITLNIPSILLLRYGSQISTTAGTSLSGGNGGNINITAGFIVSLPNENSDIFANAFTGNGGKVNITTNGIFGLAFRPRLTPLSDITASSQFGLQGNVSLNTPGVDPSKGLNNLPVDLSDASKLVTQKCLADRQDSAFVISGRGGIPASPADVISGNNLQENMGVPTNPEWIADANRRTINPYGEVALVEKSSQAVPTPSWTRQLQSNQTSDVLSDRIVEAQGWTVNPYGEVALVAEVPKVIPTPTWARQLQCR
ncbi:filamentous hemagglutinin N-terminal domain-containing protein [Pseudanabaena galeata UHCC 0370]|uniref:Filamentous hemagglutinin N-terminal domain-containing protein n=1 Tax=Pseudanabaena galeata UHCC 0370 TaxID=3110310 RepID=A0ABU5TG25_9CYAN|nr:filamentous hemagglutinin N-terminal domain-containing protein [Pseudanabaena galeata]MEA5477021.1 filamentous hemagglutinin N-terminal domain-containing protein [Pseudanabaena galeata UHCC 0370]